MKRLLAIGAVSVLGALMIGSAAALTVNGGSIQAGNDTTLTCDANGVDIAYQTTFAAPPVSDFQVTSVDVTDINTVVAPPNPNSCVGRTLTVVLTKAGAQIATASQTIAGASENVPIGPVLASDVDDVHVAIH